MPSPHLVCRCVSRCSGEPSWPFHLVTLIGHAVLHRVRPALVATRYPSVTSVLSDYRVRAKTFASAAHKRLVHYCTVFTARCHTCEWHTVRYCKIKTIYIFWAISRSVAELWLVKCRRLCCQSVHPSVCPSRSSIVSKRLDISSNRNSFAADVCIVRVCYEPNRLTTFRQGNHQRRRIQMEY